MVRQEGLEPSKAQRPTRLQRVEIAAPHTDAKNGLLDEN
jgi:hypothetical protein